VKSNVFNNASPMKYLREMKLFDARLVIQKALEYIKACPDDLYDFLVRHPYDATVYDCLFQSDDW
jgi:hypothetical protein